MNDQLAVKLRNLPESPGVYQYFNKQGQIIYVGKAKNLKSRVRSYFLKNQQSPKTRALVEKICDLRLILTDNEIEALVLENNLIKEHKPKYNVLLKDDKTYPYIRVTNEPYPRIFATRQPIRDGSRYFGPYTEVGRMKGALKLISRIFKIRSCQYYLSEEGISSKKYRVCLDYHIKRCEGPCEGLITEEIYRQNVQGAIKVISGKTSELIEELRNRMDLSAAGMHFEEAAALRDSIKELEIYSSRQKIISADPSDRDIFSTAFEGKDVSLSVLNIRSGKLTGKRELDFRMESPWQEAEEIQASALKFYYDKTEEIPGEIIIGSLPPDNEAITGYLSKRAGKKVKFVIPIRKSESMLLLKMCSENAKLQLKEIQLQRMKKEGDLPYPLAALKRDLSLSIIPRKIECFDISHIQGTDTVASMVVFVDGRPKKSLYRKFIIKSVQGPDDFESIREVISRRYSRVMAESEQPADLIIIDGGKGQLSSAVEILNSLGMKGQKIIGLAKRLEEVFFPGESEPLMIPKASQSLRLLQHARDEAHRFAVSFHRQRRSKRTFTTELCEIPGIGEKLAEKLFIEFGSIEGIRNASEDDLGKTIGPAKAGIIRAFYQNKKAKQSGYTE